MSADKGLAITWSHLLENARRSSEYALQARLARFAAQARDKPNAPGVAAIFGASSQALARAAAALGTAPLADAASALNDGFATVLASFKPPPTRPNEVDLLLLLQYDSTLRCCSYPPGIPSREPQWIPLLANGAKRLSEIEIRTTAFLAIASDQAALLPKLIGGTIPDFQPGSTFQFNVDGFIRHLAAGLSAGADAEAVEPAWSDFLQAFPRLLGSDVLTWAGLMTAARAVFTRFHGADIGSVAQRLHDRVIALP